jgi:hypothetical protein
MATQPRGAATPAPEGDHVAVPQRQGRTHRIVSTDREAGTVVTLCGRTLHVRASAWSGEAPYREGWDYAIDCSGCRRAPGDDA